MRRVPQHLQVKVIKWFDYLWFTQKSSDEEKAVGGLPGTYDLNGFSFVSGPPGGVGLSPFASLRLRRVPVHVSLLLNKSPSNSTQIKWGAEQRKRVVNNPALGCQDGCLLRCLLKQLFRAQLLAPFTTPCDSAMPNFGVLKDGERRIRDARYQRHNGRQKNVSPLELRHALYLCPL
jgi:hypothetical protein